MKDIKGVFKNNITYVEYARRGVIYFTDNIEEVAVLVKNGWRYSKYSKGFRVIPPEEVIVDITDYKKSLQYENVIVNLAYYDFLKEIIENNFFNNYINSILEKKKLFYRDFEYLVSYGPILDTEVIIAGSDNRIKNLKIDMIENFIKFEDSQKYLIEVRNQINLPKQFECYNKKFQTLTLIEKNFYYKVKKMISYIKDVETYNPLIYKYNNIDLINKLDIDIILFNPFGCFKYLSSFLTEKNLEKVMFWEIHAEDNKESTFKLFDKNMYNKKVLIVDSMYSGKTIRILKNKVEERGGKPILLGISPRNKNNILMADYVLILNTIYPTNCLDINDVDLFRNKYIEIFKEDNNDKHK